MSQPISSPVEKFPGTITLHDPLTLPMVAGYETAMLEAQAQLREAVIDVRVFPQSKLNLLILPGVLPCIARFEIAGVPEHPTAETFPYAPRQAASELVAWVINTVTEAVNGEAVPEG